VPLFATFSYRHHCVTAKTSLPVRGTF